MRHFLILALLLALAVARPARAECPACESFRGRAMTIDAFSVNFGRVPVGTEAVSGGGFAPSFGYRFGRLGLRAELQMLTSDPALQLSRLGLAARYAVAQVTTGRSGGLRLFVHASVGQEFFRWSEGQRVVRTLSRPDLTAGVGLAWGWTFLAPMGLRVTLDASLVAAPRPGIPGPGQPTPIHGTDTGYLVQIGLGFDL
jgi:hypothetical protein